MIIRAAAAVLPLMLAVTAPAWAGWQKPLMCSQDPTGWSDYDEAVVVAWDYTSPDKPEELEVSDVRFDEHGIGKADVHSLISTTTLRIDVNYTPFLNGYESFVFGVDIPKTYILPIPGQSATPGSKLYDVVTFTVYNAEEKAIPNAFVMFTPDFSGSSPYYMQADGNGQLIVSCFQLSPHGNSAFITLPQDTSQGGDATVMVNGNGDGFIIVK